ncbi:PucR family transcriptional regulator [Arthrobacter sp. AETb3-4]|uniref:PucR family transcriptional regulator n=2 Tax=Arthrobacter wenxiniae TaxID=2713570 RepID=A0A7Y7IKG8_9MICC|nr:PucR family transcriptional regulator [Arthrobacter wenxiniae]NVM96913.1 PucR family transcriptional regulator [Arthrobacter wenxiniae]
MGITIRRDINVISLAQLHNQLGNDLRPVSGATVARRKISGVHISELEDPTPYLEGGELLLTTGIPVAGPALKMEAYVQRLVARGVGALGLGLGAGVDEVPHGLAEACQAAGLELLIIPTGTPFMAVSRAYWDLVGKEGQADLTASLGTQTALAQAAAQPDALASVIKALAQALGGWAAYLPADNAAATFWPESNRAILGQLWVEASRLDMAATHSASTFQIHGTDVVEYPVLVGRRAAGFLAIGAGRKLTRADRQVILTVCVLLSLKAAQAQEKDEMAAALGSAVTKLFLAGYVEAGRAQAADLGFTVPPGPVRVLVVRGSDDPTADARALEGRLSRETGWTVAGAAVQDSRLLHVEGNLACWLLDAEHDGGTTDPAETPPSFNRWGTEGSGAGAQGGRSESYTSGKQGHRHPTERCSPATDVAAVLSRPMSLGRVREEIGELTALARRLEPHQIVEVAAGQLDPRVQEWVSALRGYTRADLVSTVRAYLQHRGQWEGAARQLGVHRNSLRHRMGIATALLHADPDDPDVAANLWLALRSE